MRHARADYQRIQDPIGKIPADEPVFLLRASDVLMPEMLACYIEGLMRIGAHPDLIALTESWRSHVIGYQKAYPPKIPDLAGTQKVT